MQGSKATSLLPQAATRLIASRSFEADSDWSIVRERATRSGGHAPPHGPAWWGNGSPAIPQAGELPSRAGPTDGTALWMVAPTGFRNSSRHSPALHPAVACRRRCLGTRPGTNAPEACARRTCGFPVAPGDRGLAAEGDHNAPVGWPGRAERPPTSGPVRGICTRVPCPLAPGSRALWLPGIIGKDAVGAQG